MPVSRSGKLYFTDEQYSLAREASALAYALANRYDLRRDGNVYYLREHDSMVFKRDGKWFWNSRQLRGRALEFIQHYEGKSLPEAVLILAGDLARPEATYLPPIITEDESQPFELPARAGSFRRLFAYLCGTRCLDVDIVRDLVREKRLYEGIREYVDKDTGEIRAYHNAVFVGMDKGGVPRSAYQRGLSSNAQSGYKGDVTSSEKEYGFCVAGRRETRVVAVFEAAIDAISHATLAKGLGYDYLSVDRLVLGGTCELALTRYLIDHPRTDKIWLCLDNDEAGREGAAQLESVLRAMGYTNIEVSVPRGCKDWNEYLCLESRYKRQKAQQNDDDLEL